MRQLTKSDADEIEYRSRNTTGRKVQTFIVTDVVDKALHYNGKIKCFCS